MAGTDDDGDSPRGTISPAERDAFRKRAKDLENRLGGVTKKRTSRERQQRPSPWSSPAAGRAMRFAVELVVGVAVGGFIGWFLDGQFGTRPWLLVVFVILGFAAAINNIIRVAREMQAETEARQRATPAVPDNEDDD